MLKISSSDTKGFFIKYIIRVILSTVISLVSLTALFSYIFVKLDLDLKLVSYCVFAIAAVSSFIVSFFSTLKIKNNLLALSVISTIPISIITIVNTLIEKGSITDLIINIILIVILSCVSAIIKSSRKR